MSQYDEYYTFKTSGETSYRCLTSKTNNKKYILGTNKKFIPLDFWFCRSTELALPIGYIGGQPFDLRQQQNQIVQVIRI